MSVSSKTDPRVHGVLAGTEELRRRRFIKLAEQHPAWREIAASFSLSGIYVTEDNAAIAGQMIAGELTVHEVIEQIKRQQAATGHIAPDV